jgi:hypothetical protein
LSFFKKLYKDFHKIHLNLSFFICFSHKKMVNKNDVILHGQYYSHAKTYLLIISTFLMYPMFCEQNKLHFQAITSWILVFILWFKLLLQEFFKNLAQEQLSFVSFMSWKSRFPKLAFLSKLDCNSRNFWQIDWQIWWSYYHYMAKS